MALEPALRDWANEAAAGCEVYVFGGSMFLFASQYSL